MIKKPTLPCKFEGLVKTGKGLTVIVETRIPNKIIVANQTVDNIHARKSFSSRYKQFKF
jgi:hypothetical protein